MESGDSTAGREVEFACFDVEHNRLRVIECTYCTKTVVIFLRGHRLFTVFLHDYFCYLCYTINGGRESP